MRYILVSIFVLYMSGLHVADPPFQNSKMCHLLGKDQHVRAHIRRYTAEAFAFLMRKARKEKLADLIRHILESLLENGTEEYIEGLSMLFFESMKVL